MKYQVTIVETLSKIVDIEANSAEQAEYIVMTMYNDEEVVLDYSDFEQVDFITFEDK